MSIHFNVVVYIVCNITLGIYLHVQISWSVAIVYSWIDKSIKRGELGKRYDSFGTVTFS